jgi:hypothetical protein
MMYLFVFSRLMRLHYIFVVLWVGGECIRCIRLYFYFFLLHRMRPVSLNHSYGYQKQNGQVKRLGIMGRCDRQHGLCVCCC